MNNWRKQRYQGLPGKTGSEKKKHLPEYRQPWKVQKCQWLHDICRSPNIVVLIFVSRVPRTTRFRRLTVAQQPKGRQRYIHTSRLATLIHFVAPPMTMVSNLLERAHWSVTLPRAHTHYRSRTRRKYNKSRRISPTRIWESSLCHNADTDTKRRRLALQRPVAGSAMG